MRAFIIIFLLLPLVSFAEEVRIAVGQGQDEVVATIKKHGGTDITSGLDIVGPRSEHPLSGIYWEFQDYDAIVSLTTKDGVVVGMTFWTKKDFAQSKIHRSETQQGIVALKIDTDTKGISIEKTKAKG